MMHGVDMASAIGTTIVSIVASTYSTFEWRRTERRGRLARRVRGLVPQDPSVLLSRRHPAITDHILQ